MRRAKHNRPEMLEDQQLSENGFESRSEVLALASMPCMQPLLYSSGPVTSDPVLLFDTGNHDLNRETVACRDAHSRPSHRKSGHMRSCTCTYLHSTGSGQTRGLLRQHRRISHPSDCVANCKMQLLCAIAKKMQRAPTLSIFTREALTQ